MGQEIGHMTGQVYFSETDEGGRYIFIPMGTSRVDGPFEFRMDYIRISVPGGGGVYRSRTGCGGEWRSSQVIPHTAYLQLSYGYPSICT